MRLPLGLKERGVGGEGGRGSKKLFVSSNPEGQFWAPKPMFYSKIFRVVFLIDFFVFFH